jgi:hypothetical protein
MILQGLHAIPFILTYNTTLNMIGSPVIIQIKEKSAHTDFSYGILRRLIAQDTVEQMAVLALPNYRLTDSGTQH